MKTKQKTFGLIIIVLWLLFIIFFPLILLTPPPAAAQSADWSYVSPDLDSDGLPNDVETGGWCNAVGCFTTNPLVADSDHDGLTDGEEKFFDSDPNDSASPGIYVIYEDPLKTKEYYPWQPYGHKLIARGDNFTPTKPDSVDVAKGLGNNLNAVIARRGTSFYVGGPLTTTLTYQKSLSSLSNLTLVRDPLKGWWRVTVPSTTTGTIGQYTLIMGDKTLDLFVIFELPAPSGELTQAAIDRFVYDDNPSTTLDNRSVLMADQTDYYCNSAGQCWTSPTADWWDGQFPPYTVTIPPGEFLAEGGGYYFNNQQYNRYLLEDYVMPAINGQTTPQAAAARLVNQVDANTAFRNPRATYNAWDTLTAFKSSVDKRVQCSGIAGTVTALNRAVGIPARVLLTDWRASTFDHADEIWVNGQWRVYRGYSTYELSDNVTPLYHSGTCADATTWPACGNNQYYTRANWGTSHYRPWHSGGGGSSNLIASVSPDFADIDVRAYRWPSWVADGDKRGVTMARQASFITLHDEYWGGWGWTTEPTVTGSSPETWPQSPEIISGSIQSATNLDFQSSPVQLGQVVSESQLDRDGNGQYDQLVLDVEVTVTTPGDYWLRGELSAGKLTSTTATTGSSLSKIYLPLILNTATAQPDTRLPKKLSAAQSMPPLAAAGGVVAEAYVPVTLNAGSHIVRLVFDGTSLSLSRTDGPYHLSGLWITNAPNPGPTDFMNNSLAYRANLYTTKPYRFTDFQTYGAMLADTYTYTLQDGDNNGALDTVVINTAINVYQPGTYKVEADLYDNQEQLIGHTVWSGAGPAVTLRFNQVAGAVAPYFLRNLTLLNPNGLEIDTLANAYTLNIPSLPGNASFDTYPAGSDDLIATGVTITPTLVFTSARVGGNLQVGAQVQVAVAGSYKLEAWLADVNGNLITWASGPSATLPTGLQRLFLTFDGRNIRLHGVNGPYRVVALKILDGNATYQVLDKVNIAHTTSAYLFTQFAAVDSTLFADSMENGSSQWVSTSPWLIEQGTHLYFSPSQAWFGSNGTGSLQLAAPLNLSNKIDVVLKFQTAYNFGVGETGYVEASTDGVTWNTEAAFSGLGDWSRQTEIVDLKAYIDNPAVYLRFRLDSAGGTADSWYIDDVVVAELPRYALNVATVGAGSVVSAPVQSTYIYGDAVTLTAAAQPGWTFGGWSGSASGSASPLLLTMKSNKVVTATFTQDHYVLGITTVGRGGVVSTPVQSTYLYGQVVTLTAVTNPGWIFSGWSGGVSGSSSSITVTMNSAQGVTATFTAIPYTLQVTMVGGGGVVSAPVQSTYIYGQVITLTAQPEPGWAFSGWSGSASGITSPLTVTVKGNQAVTATFTTIPYTLRVTTVGAGSVVSAPVQSTYTYSQMVTLTATAQSGWTFGGWSGSATGITSPITLTMQNNRVVTATFTQDHYILGIATVGRGGVVSAPVQSTYIYGQVVTLTATAQPGWTFGGWSGSATDITSPITVTMNSHKVVTATFTQDHYVLGITTVGAGSVVSVPVQSTYLYGQVVTLTAVTNPGWIFSGWSGGVSGSSSSITVTMNSAQGVTATFTAIPYTLRVTTVGAGSVVSAPVQSTYIYGQVVTLTATAQPGWTFGGWSGSATGITSPITLTIQNNRVVTATFTQDHYVLGITTVGAGSVVSTPVQSTYLYGQVVTLTATAQPGWTFGGWSGSITGITSPITVTMNSHKVITATFTQDHYILGITTVGCGGVVSVPVQSTYIYGQVVTLTATANPGWTFSGWSGGAAGATSPVTVTMTNNKTVTATFTALQYTLKTNIVGQGQVVTAPAKSTYLYGDVVTLTAIANPGWIFSGWSGSLSGSTTPITVTMNESKTITANFTAFEYTLRVTTIGSGSVISNPVKSTYHYGDVVTLTAIGNPPNWALAGWSGDLAGRGVTNPITLTINGNKAVTAIFMINPTTLDFSKSALDVNDAPLLITDTIRYTVQVTNTGVNTAQNLVITDTLPVSVTTIHVDVSQGDVSGTGQIVWQVGQLLPTIQATMIITVTLNPDTLGQSVINMAAAKADNSFESVAQICPDNKPPSNDMCSNTPLPIPAPPSLDIFLPIIVKGR